MELALTVLVLVFFAVALHLMRNREENRAGRWLSFMVAAAILAVLGLAV
ncbi:hypothetical protein [Quadrisphaera sp. DSM 44207]|nr:hypothetical protein [Quadrisphaera sp. DSM 44207]SDQ72915.1 hypothetical protein SAMN05428996_2572 [Quadrisphaera sp. DSM 44207]